MFQVLGGKLRTFQSCIYFALVESSRGCLRCPVCAPHFPSASVWRPVLFPANDIPVFVLGHGCSGAAPPQKTFLALCSLKKLEYKCLSFLLSYLPLFITHTHTRARQGNPDAKSRNLRASHGSLARHMLSSGAELALLAGSQSASCSPRKGAAELSLARFPGTPGTSRAYKPYVGKRTSCWVSWGGGGVS